ncbi:hypothetical protein IID10_21785 [candidate division KSB1 bacterium]|nr:hypothetical protein [candidate division KSB1 bacterium]
MCVPYDIIQRLAFVAGHGDKHLTILRLINFVDCADVRVVERRGRFGFVDEALFVFLILTQVRWQKLQSNKAVEFGVLGFVDHAHAAFAELFKDSIMRYCFANHLFRATLKSNFQ